MTDQSPSTDTANAAAVMALPRAQHLFMQWQGSSALLSGLQSSHQLEKSLYPALKIAAGMLLTVRENFPTADLHAAVRMDSFIKKFARQACLPESRAAALALAVCDAVQP